MQMRIHHDIYIVGRQIYPAKLADNIVVASHGRNYCPRQTSPPLFRVLGDTWVTTGIEQHIALWVAKQETGNRQLYDFPSAASRT